MRYAKYKKTGIPWLPEVPEGWGMVRNKTFLSITEEKVGDRRNDFTLLSLTKQGVIVRDLSQMKGKFPKDFDTYLVVRPNNLVFCLFDVDETPRTVGLVKNVGMLTGAYTNFEVDDRYVVPEYASYYYIQMDDAKKLRPYYTGLRKVVKTNTFMQLKFPLPPLPTQRAIVAYLDAKCGRIDSLVAAKEKEIELLKELKQATIAEAVTGKVEVEKRGGGGQRKFKPSGIPWLPQVPDGWEVAKVRQLAKDSKTKNKGNEEKNVLSLSYGRIVRKKDIYAGLAPTDFATYQIVEQDYTVLRLTDLQNDHRSLRCGFVGERGIITSAYISLIPQNVYPKYLYLALHTCDLNKLFYSMGGGLRQSMNYADLANIFLPLPPREEQERIVAYIERETARIDSAAADLTRQVAALKEYKQRLIADVVTGQEKVA